MVLLTATLVAPGAAAAAARVREYTQVFTTYPFSDPNPVPVPGRIYPYLRFDGYTDVPVERAWTVVELENDYVRVLCQWRANLDGDRQDDRPAVHLLQPRRQVP